MTAHDPVLSAQDVADEIDKAYRTVLAYLRSGELAGVKHGKFWFIRRSALDRFLEPDTATRVA